MDTGRSYFYISNGKFRADSGSHNILKYYLLTNHTVQSQYLDKTSPDKTCPLPKVIQSLWLSSHQSLNVTIESDAVLGEQGFTWAANSTSTSSARTLLNLVVWHQFRQLHATSIPLSHNFCWQKNFPLLYLLKLLVPKGYSISCRLLGRVSGPTCPVWNYLITQKWNVSKTFAKYPPKSVVFTEIHGNIFAWESLLSYNIQQITEIKPPFISVIPENTDMARRI